MRALREATGGSSVPTTTGPSPTTNEPLAIKGASTSQGGNAGTTSGNVVEVSGLVRGTTPDDVCTIFKRCGPIASARAVFPPASADAGVTVRIAFKSPASAAAAVHKFHKHPADGRTLNVKIVGTIVVPGATLSGADRLGIVWQEGSVDVLTENGPDHFGSCVFRCVFGVLIVVVDWCAGNCGRTRSLRTLGRTS